MDRTDAEAFTEVTFPTVLTVVDGVLVLLAVEVVAPL